MREADRAEEAAEAERDIEREVRAADALERERDKAPEHEIRVLELTNSKGDFDQSMADAAMRPKLPVFKDGDDIVSFMIRTNCCFVKTYTRKLCCENG